MLNNYIHELVFCLPCVTAELPPLCTGSLQLLLQEVTQMLFEMITELQCTVKKKKKNTRRGGVEGRSAD